MSATNSQLPKQISRKIIFIVLLAIFSLIAVFSIVEKELVTHFDARKYKGEQGHYPISKTIEYSLGVTNQTSRVLKNGEARLHLLVGRSAFQKVEDLRVDVKHPAIVEKRILFDGYGNRTLFLKLKNFQNDESLKVHVRAEVSFSNTPNYDPPDYQSLKRYEMILGPQVESVLSTQKSSKPHGEVMPGKAQNFHRLLSWFKNIDKENLQDIMGRLNDESGNKIPKAPIRRKIGNKPDIDHDLIKRNLALSALLSAAKIPARTVLGTVLKGRNENITKINVWVEYFDEERWHVLDEETYEPISEPSNYFALRILDPRKHLSLISEEFGLYELAGLRSIPFRGKIVVPQSGYESEETNSNEKIS